MIYPPVIEWWEAALPTSPHQFWNALLHLSHPDTHYIITVAVPINSGMLSYGIKGMKPNGILVAVPINSGMLSYTKSMWQVLGSLVAVPINSGMLSYMSAIIFQGFPYCRSPHQFWNALLP